MNIDRGDVNIMSSVIEIPIGESKACIQLEAVDDNIVENEEEFILAVKAINMNDVLDSNTTIFISDNDGMSIRSRPIVNQTTPSLSLHNLLRCGHYTR